MIPQRPRCNRDRPLRGGRLEPRAASGFDQRAAGAAAAALLPLAQLHRSGVGGGAAEKEKDAVTDGYNGALFAGIGRRPALIGVDLSWFVFSLKWSRLAGCLSAAGQNLPLAAEGLGRCA